ncbi:MAG: oxidoreductase [Cyclobacteriaceae bacterium]|nr:oxidoreductase [Cyclobacteriaceae bacterium]
MTDRVALVAGSTGLIGAQLLKLLLDDVHYAKVIALSRKPLNLNHPKLENVIVLPGEWDSLLGLKATDVFCCLGTTIKQAKSKEAFRQIDYEYPVELAKALKASGATGYYLVSALGADKTSRIFYNQVKGETETTIKEVGFSSYHIFRPSLLLGDRKEQRAGEDAAKVFYKIFGFLIPKKYQAIDSLKVAKAMLAEAKQNRPGNFIHESSSMQQY